MDLGTPVPRHTTSKRPLCFLVLGITGLTTCALVGYLRFPTSTPKHEPEFMAATKSVELFVERAPEFLGLWDKVARSPPDEMHELILVVKNKNEKEFEEKVLQLADPDSKNFRQWMTYEEVQAMTRNEEGLQAVKDALGAFGEKVSIVKETSGELVRARAPMSIWEDLLKAEFHVYRHSETGKQSHRASEFTLPEHLSGHVAGVLGVLDLEHQPVEVRTAKPKIELRKSADLTHAQESGLNLSAVELLTLDQFVTPQKIRSAYKMPAMAEAGSEEALQRAATSQAVFASLKQSWSQKDLDTFAKAFHIPQTKVTQLPPPPDQANSDMCDSCCRANVKNCMEANLDVQYMLSMSPWSEMGVFYVDSEAHPNVFHDLLEALSAMSSPPLVMSISYGAPEIGRSSSLINAFNSIASKLAGMGVTLLASSGDSGANTAGTFLPKKYTCSTILSQLGLTVSWPASSPWVTSVGATMGIESNMTEIACSTDATGPTADASPYPPSITSGGGFSQMIKRPNWQPPYQGQMGRGVPDVSLAGHAYITVTGGQGLQVDGTSASSPALGGMVTVLNAYLKAGYHPQELQAQPLEAASCPKHTGGTCRWWKCHGYRHAVCGSDYKCGCGPGMCARNGVCINETKRVNSVGFLNPLLYKYKDKGIFNDITEGSNKCARRGEACCGGYEAGPGWDPVTGLGTVNAEGVMELLGISTVV